jgi:uncharacterized membrane protein
MGITLGLPHYKKCLRVHGKKVFRKILESFRLIVNGYLKTLHNEKLPNLYSSSIIIIISSSSNGSGGGGGGGSSSSVRYMEQIPLL